MQDFHSIPGLAGRIFGGGGGGGGGGGAENRRLRGYPGGCGGQEPPAKCPRCESTNTKFCYYNNYNLSQPRHFCKSCRRYWTKGGVLRNVPVGGGCRKSSSSSSKRSSSSSKKSSSKDRRRSPAAASRSSSDSSSLTAAAAEASTSASATASASPFFTDPALFAPQRANPKPNLSTDFDLEEEIQPPPPMISGTDIFLETGTFTSLMTSATAGPGFLGLNFSDPPPPPPPLQFGVHQQLQHKAASNRFETDEIRMAGLTSGFIHQTVPADLLPPPQQQEQEQFDGRMSGGGGLDWTGATAEHSLFDFSGGGVDPGAYWNQGQWSDADPASLYLP